MQKYFPQKRKGFSLVELMVALFVFGIVMLGVSSVFTQTFSSYRYAKNLQRDVENMKFMFANSKFNGDISKWDVSNVKDMFGTFEGSKFNGDISRWRAPDAKLR